MIIREILAKGILSKSKVYDYVINPYIGCQHSCSYCYARFMKRFSGHAEIWGEFVDIKINAVDLLKHEIARKKPGRVWVSGVCDPYQPLERRYQLTRRCLEILVQNHWQFTVQTRSPMVVRDIDILRQAPNAEVGMSITTADERMRRLFEPKAPTIASRIKALEELRRAGIRTFVMIAPLLPGAERLDEVLTGKVDRVLIDKMNYFYADWVYRKNNLVDKLTPEFFAHVSGELCAAFKKQGVECSSFC